MTPNIPFRILRLASLAVMASAGAAFAHSEMGAAFGFATGLAHPILGADHLLAMLAVGLWSGFALSRHVWRGAAAFLAAMAVGAALGLQGGPSALVEAGILASVVVFGLLTIFAHPGLSRGLTAGAFAAIAGFALFHGYAHAAEAAGTVAPYVAGFLLATAALHMTGIVLARAVASRVPLRWSIGGAIAVSGAVLALG